MEALWALAGVFSSAHHPAGEGPLQLYAPSHLQVAPPSTEDEALPRANATEFGLAAGVFTADLARAHRMAAGFQAGSCFINAYNLTPVEAPFGGVRQSGVGRENSRAAIDHYSQLQSVYVGMGPCTAQF